MAVQLHPRPRLLRSAKEGMERGVREAALRSHLPALRHWAWRNLPLPTCMIATAWSRLLASFVASKHAASSIALLPCPCAQCTYTVRPLRNSLVAHSTPASSCCMLGTAGASSTCWGCAQPQPHLQASFTLRAPRVSHTGRHKYLGLVCVRGSSHVTSRTERLPGGSSFALLGQPPMSQPGTICECASGRPLLGGRARGGARCVRAACPGRPLLGGRARGGAACVPPAPAPTPHLVVQRLRPQEYVPRGQQLDAQAYVVRQPERP